MNAIAGNQLRTWPGRWFYFCCSCLIAAVVGYGFSHTIGNNLLHAKIPRPFVLWVHALVFGGWIVLFIVQITLIRTRHIRWHRRLGVAAMLLGAAIPVIGVATSLEMARFDLDHGLFDAVESAAFLSIPFNDMIFFAGALAAAFWWRTRPEIHRRMMLLATCLLTAAAFARFPFITIRALHWYPGVDALLLLAVAHDIRAGRRVHRAYAISLPLVVSGQIAAMWLYLARPTWWVEFAQRLF
jgi:hypothetical protein